MLGGYDCKAQILSKPRTDRTIGDLETMEILGDRIIEDMLPVQAMFDGE